MNTKSSADSVQSVRELVERTRELEITAQNESDPAKLAEYAQHWNAEVRCSVALNWSTPTSTLRLLATDLSAHVRQAVAANLMTPADLLEELAAEDTYWMRFCLAGNLSTPAGVDARLRERDPESYERARALKAGGMRSSISTLLKKVSA